MLHGLLTYVEMLQIGRIYNEDIMDLLQWLLSDPVGQRGLTDQPEIDPPLLQQT